MHAFCYPAAVTVDTAGFHLVTFPDVPEAGTDAETYEEALCGAADALIAALGGYIRFCRKFSVAALSGMLLYRNDRGEAL